jgi:hypothetical protein
VENPTVDGAGLSKWQRARLVLDQYQRGVDAGPVGQVLPVRAGLARLLPHGGLRRGSTMVVRGSVTVLLALLAEATAEGSWAAVVGMPDLGVLAAAELGVEISRLALVPKPGAELGGVVAALLDGIDLVVVATPNVQPTLARRLSARARHRESVLLTSNPWPGADVALECAASTWSGLGWGHGHLAARELTVTTQGRGMADRPTRTRITLPADPEADLRAAQTCPDPLAVPRGTGSHAAQATADSPGEPDVVGLHAVQQRSRAGEWPTRLGRLPGPFGPQPPTAADPDPDFTLAELDFEPDDPAETAMPDLHTVGAG